MGWFIDAPEDPPEGFPADLLTVLATARASGADYDCDAVRNQTLPIPHPDFRD